MAFLDAVNQPGIDNHLSVSDEWKINDSSFGDYCEPMTHYGLQNLHMIVGRRLASHRRAVGIDIAGGSNGAALQDLLYVGLLCKALVTNLRDTHTQDIANLDHLEGNILSKETWVKMVAWTDKNTEGEGPAIIMHRPAGPLQYLPAETYRGAAHFLLDMLRPGGVLLCQVPLSLVNVPNKAPLARIHQSIEQRPDVESVVSFPNFFYPRPAAIMKAF